MALFGNSRDISLFNTVSKELINDIIPAGDIVLRIAKEAEDIMYSKLPNLAG